MRKVIKIFLSIVSAIILTAIIIPVCVWLLLFLPPVQNFAVRQFSDYASRKLETTVSFDRVNLKLFNRAEFDGFYVEDHGGDTLVYAAELSAGIDIWALVKGRLEFDDVRFSGGVVDIRQNPDGSTNLQPILEKLRRKTPRPDRPFILSASALALEDMRFRYRKHGAVPNSHGIDFGDIDLSEVHLHSDRISVKDGTTSLRLNLLSLRDKSGFFLKSLSSRTIAVSGKTIDLDMLKAEIPGSEITADYLRLSYPELSALKSSPDSVTISVSISNSSIGPETVAFFATSHSGLRTKFSNINITVDGSLADLHGNISRTKINGSELSARFAAHGLRDLKSAVFDITVDSLVTDAAQIALLAEDFMKRELSDSTMASLRSFGRISVRGNFRGSASSFSANSVINTAQGRADANLNFTPSKNRATSFVGKVDMRSVNMGPLLNIHDLGNVTLTAGVNGSYGRGHMELSTDANLSHVSYNGYDYRDITMNGTVSNRRFSGRLGSSDPNLDLDFDGILDFNDSIPRYDFRLDVRNADLARLNLNTRDSVSIVRLRAEAYGSGARLDDLNGKIVVDDFLYISAADIMQTGEIAVTGTNSANSKHIVFNSSFADAEFRSRASYSRLADYLRESLYAYLPSLSGRIDNGAKHTAAMEGSDIDNYSVLTVNVKQANNIAGIFVPGLIVAEGTALSFMFNPEADMFSLKLNSDYMERGNSFVSDIEINSYNRADSLLLFLRTGELFTSGMMLPDFSVNGAAHDNRIAATARFVDSVRDRTALIGANILLGRDSISGVPRTNIRLTPSYFTHGNQRWNIFSRGINIEPGVIDVDTLTIRGPGQQVRLYGTASKSERDTLHLNLHNFNVTPFTPLIGMPEYDITGRATGNASVSSILEDGILHAGIVLDSLRINAVEAPPVFFESNWDFEQKRALFALTKTSREAMTSVGRNGDFSGLSGITLRQLENIERSGWEIPGPLQDRLLAVGAFRPSDGYRGRINIKGVDLSLLDPLVPGVLTNTKGRADARLSFRGRRREWYFNDEIHVSSMSTTVGYLNVPYMLAENTSIKVTDNVLTLNSARLYDPSGNSAAFDMRVDLNKLKNIAYQFDFRPENLLLLNTDEQFNNLFYGKVYASGAGSVRGNKGSVKIDVTAATSGPSEFYMPLNDKADMSDADFITFVTPKTVAAPDSSDYAVRKRMIMSRNIRRRAAAATSNLDLTLNLDVRENTLAELLIDPETGHTIRGRGNGSLVLHVNPRNNEFTMYGDYGISEGTYLFTLENIIEKPFAIEPGSTIQWTGDPIDALLNISAVYRLKTSVSAAYGAGASGYDNYSRVRIPVECHIMLTDRLSMPTLTFNITAPGATPETQAVLANFLNTQEMMATQFFFLLATGSLYDYTGSQANIGAMAGSATAFDFLSNQLSNWISSDKFNIGFRYRPRSEVTSDEWGIDFSQQLLGNRLLLEIEGNYDTGNNAAAINNRNIKNFTGDFYLTGLLDKSGNVKAKVFTRTIDRFDENQGLQESGVGLYYTEDFNTFGEIWQNIKDRFSGERRRKRLLQKQIAKEMEEEEKKTVDNKKIKDEGSAK